MKLLSEYFPQLTEKQIEQYNQLGVLYASWNEKINIISRKDIDYVYERHILHSLGIAKVIQFTSQTTVLDVGTGGGLPGIPLAIMFPNVQFTLVDSIGKKIHVVREISASLGLQNVIAKNERAEKIDEKFDFVTSRAVTQLKVFHSWVKDKFLKGGNNTLPNGILYLKGGDLEKELKEYGGKTKIFPLSEYFKEEFFLTKKVVYVPVR